MSLHACEHPSYPMCKCKDRTIYARQSTVHLHYTTVPFPLERRLGRPDG